MYRARETKPLEIIEQFFSEPPAFRQPGEFIGLESKLLQELQHLLQAGREEEISRRRQFAHREFEHRRFMLLRFDVCLEHRQLIKIGQQRGTMWLDHAERLDHANSFPCSRTAPRRAISSAPVGVVRLGRERLDRIQEHENLESLAERVVHRGQHAVFSRQAADKQSPHSGGPQSRRKIGVLEAGIGFLLRLRGF